MTSNRNDWTTSSNVSISSVQNCWNISNWTRPTTCPTILPATMWISSIEVIWRIIQQADRKTNFSQSDALTTIFFRSNPPAMWNGRIRIQSWGWNVSGSCLALHLHNLYRKTSKINCTFRSQRQRIDLLWIFAVGGENGMLLHSEWLGWVAWSKDGSVGIGRKILKHLLHTSSYHRNRRQSLTRRQLLS